MKEKKKKREREQDNKVIILWIPDFYKAYFSQEGLMVVFHDCKIFSDS